MSLDRNDVEIYGRAAAEVLDLPLPESLQPGVFDHLETLFRQAALFMDMPLPDSLEAAAVFHP